LISNDLDNRNYLILIIM